MAARAGWLLLLLGSFGCGRAVTSEPLSGRHGAYAIECAQKAQCVARAETVCGGRYQVVSEWTRPALLRDPPPPEPLLPNGRSTAASNRLRHTVSSNTGPVVHDRALLSRLEVVCVN